MAGKTGFLQRFMQMTEKTRNVWGPADRSDFDSPVVHKHDEYESASEAELAEFEIERDEEGHTYAIRKRHDTGMETAGG
ncbi:hypothetical protein [Arthrobacter mobilis]|uniref:Uncharacterized protein n=1 Tax=Arthrobacter mobilis TaxID=2724944 RepID=A0A7X6HE58_9MICC|nr:hypothetical protein [Arthrobacter mobilis]NKX54336.1 hypothetical protein [Arthrobacter mobilis]